MDAWLKPRKGGEDFPKDLHRYKNPRMVQVDWIDSTGFTGWWEDVDWKNRAPNRCQSVGYLMSQDGEALHLAASRDCEGSFNGRQSIPKGCVKVIRQLEVKNGQKGNTKTNTHHQGRPEASRR